jgi:predicted ArsR family transcriptional regulator
MVCRMPPASIITPAREDEMGRLAARPSGVTVPEIADAFGVSKWTARRAVLRMVQARRLTRTSKRRPRRTIFERAGRGGVVYHATAEERRRWVGWRNSRGRPRTKGKWW